MTTDDKLRELANELPWDRPDKPRREAVRASVLLAASELAPAPAPARARSTSGRAIAGIAFAGGVLAAAAVALILGGRGSDRPGVVAHARISASTAAALEHTVTATATGVDEVIRVHTGTVHVDTPAAHASDRARVVTRDAEVEGAGEYIVVVAADALTSVTVRSGEANVRVNGRQHPVFLSAGETWQAAIVTADLVAPTQPSSPAQPSSPTQPSSSTQPALVPMSASDPSASASSAALPAPAPSSSSARTQPESAVAPKAWPLDDPPAVARSSTLSPSGTGTGALPAPRRTSPTERHFQAGWALLRANKPREAALELAEAADAAETDPLAPDARYFQAVALIKAGQGASAERALIAFLDHAPRSLRRGRAAVMLARLIAERGDARSARAWFEAALADPDRDVAAAARTGLDDLARRPAGP